MSWEASRGLAPGSCLYVLSSLSSFLSMYAPCEKGAIAGIVSAPESLFLAIPTQVTGLFRLYIQKRSAGRHINPRNASLHYSCTARTGSVTMFFRNVELPGYDIEGHVRESETIVHEYD